MSANVDTSACSRSSPVRRVSRRCRTRAVAQLDVVLHVETRQSHTAMKSCEVAPEHMHDRLPRIPDAILRADVYTRRGRTPVATQLAHVGTHVASCSCAPCGTKHVPCAHVMVRNDHLQACLWFLCGTAVDPCWSAGCQHQAAPHMYTTAPRTSQVVTVHRMVAWRTHEYQYAP
jgi:hypothetical protein